MLTPVGSAPAETASGELESLVAPSPSCPLALMPQARAFVAAEADTAPSPNATATTADSNTSRTGVTARAGRPLRFRLRRARACNGVMVSMNKEPPAIRPPIVVDGCPRSHHGTPVNFSHGGSDVLRTFPESAAA